MFTSCIRVVCAWHLRSGGVVLIIIAQPVRHPSMHVLVSAVHGFWPAVSMALLPRAYQSYPWLIPACTAGSLQKPSPVQTPASAWRIGYHATPGLSARCGARQPPVQHPVVPPAGCSAAPNNRDRDIPEAEKALISPWTMSIGHLLMYIDALYSYQSTSSTTSRCTTCRYKCSTWGSWPRQLSPHEHCPYLPSSDALMHYVRSQHITGSPHEHFP